MDPHISHFRRAGRRGQRHRRAFRNKGPDHVVGDEVRPQAADLLEPAVPPVRPTQDIRPLADFRANLAAVVRQVQRTKRSVILTQHGRSAAVLVDAEEYEALLERAQLLEDVRIAEAEIAAGRGVAHSKAKTAVLARLRA